MFMSRKQNITSPCITMQRQITLAMSERLHNVNRRQVLETRSTYRLYPSENSNNHKYYFFILVAKRYPGWSPWLLSVVRSSDCVPPGDLTVSFSENSIDDENDEQGTHTLELVEKTVFSEMFVVNCWLNNNTSYGIDLNACLRIQKWLVSSLVVLSPWPDNWGRTQRMIERTGGFRTHHPRQTGKEERPPPFFVTHLS